MIKSLPWSAKRVRAPFLSEMEGFSCAVVLASLNIRKKGEPENHISRTAQKPTEDVKCLPNVYPIYANKLVIKNG